MESQLYREHILDLWKNPLNFGKLLNPTHKHKELNSFCGDEINLEINVKKNKIQDIKFSGTGCAISIASASLLTEEIKNKSVKEISSMGKENILKLLKIPISSVRLKCALLPLEALQKGLR